jgi:hypothetical protein
LHSTYWRGAKGRCGHEDGPRITTRGVLRGGHHRDGLAHGGDNAMNATISDDDYILLALCNEFQNRHKVMLRLMALKHDSDSEMKRLVAALEHRRAALDAILALPAKTIEGHREKMRVALDIWSPTSEDDIDDQFARAVMQEFVGSGS